MAVKAGLQALILAGGRGTRFWPLSRSRRPKQLLALDSDESLLRRTMVRLAPLVPPERVWVCTTRELASAVREDLPEVPGEQILSEPMGRDTAPAIGWSVRTMMGARGDSVIAVLPADHRVADDGAFRDGLESASREVATSDRIMTLGVEPRWAETGYGYLELGDSIEGDARVRRVTRFTEKPDAETAERFVASGDYLWNAGIFVFRGGRLWDQLAEFESEMAGTLLEIEQRPQDLERLYGTLRRVSIDYAVMERCDDLATLPLDCGWSDLGSWDALAEILEAGESGNAERGDILALDANDNLLFSEEGVIAAVGVSGLIVVQTRDAVLVMPRSRSQEVKGVVEALERDDRRKLL